MAVPKTIIITALPGRNLTSVSYANSNGVSLLCAKPKQRSHMGLRNDMDSTLEYTDITSDLTKPPTRKRQRLDHLSHDEKIMRRKVKNRVAAQSARDRKKAQMYELEGTVKELEDEKDQIMIENEQLKERNSKLEQENLELKRRLGIVEDDQLAQTKSVVKKETIGCKSVRHASLISGPLQKDQDLRHPTTLMMQLVCLQVIMSLMIFLSSYKNVAKNYSSVTSILPVQMRNEFLEMKPKVKWWGAQQKTWNPSKN